MARIAAFDPGGTTGWCRYDTALPLENSYACGQFEAPDHHKLLYRWLNDNEPELIVCEQFDYRPHLQNVQLISRNYIGVIELYTQYSGCPLIMQKPAVMKPWDNDKLKLLGLYTKNLRHAMDATRHLLVYLDKIKSDKLTEKLAVLR
jgi:hypothetical protein